MRTIINTKQFDLDLCVSSHVSRTVIFIGYCVIIILVHCHSNGMNFSLWLRYIIGVVSP